MSVHVIGSLINHGLQGHLRILFGYTMIYSTNPLLLGIQVVSVIQKAVLLTQDFAPC